jgi:5-methyltetrahydrofolate--homocysteine methyltransferase
MKEEEILSKIINAIVDMDINGAKDICETAITQGIQPFKIIQDGITKAVAIIGEKFETKEFFLPELIMGGEIAKELTSILEPYIKDTGSIKALDKVVLGTGKGDLHDIGKNIVKTFLKADGFEVIDLGVDVPPEKFAEAVRVEKPKILAVSALISMTMLELEKLMRVLEQENLRDQVKVIIGGAPITQEFADSIGADAYAHDAIEGVKICRSWVQE